jgi:ubiquinone/menaquinone biosynthesis C-methylase UbiE
MSEFNDIATRYTATASMAIRQALMDTMRNVLGDVAGKAVLDLACGSGIYTRMLKEQGAGKVVGVDISSDMLALAREEEARAPLGVEYLQGDAASLGHVGDFDLVAATFLLHYARDYQQLLGMLQTIHANLLPGGRFVTANVDVRRTEGELNRDLTKYGFALRPHTSPLADGTPITVTLLLEQGLIEFVSYYLPKASYDRAFETAGLRAVNWDNRWSLSALVKDSFGHGYWDDFLACPVLCVIDCHRAA